MLEWFEHVFFPNVSDDCLLIVDSWTPYRDRQAIANVTPPSKNLEMKTVPPGTTGLVQPLDRFFFRMWKMFCRKISDRVLLDQLQIEVYQRDSLLKLQSLVHNQFSAPRFRDCIRFAWYHSHLLSERPPAFQTPVQFCFPQDLADACTALGEGVCDQQAFICCAHCSVPLCFSHFFLLFHYH